MTIDTPGATDVVSGELISTNPATGEEVARFPVASEADVRAAVARARTAGDWWAGLSERERRRRLLRWCSLLVNRAEELGALMHAEGGKPADEGTLETYNSARLVSWAAKRARKVLDLHRVRGSIIQPEYAPWVEYRPYGVVGVIGPWNFPIFTPMGSIASALAAGNAVVFKPSEYTPAVGQFYVDLFNEVVPEHPVLQIVHGLGDVGAALSTAGVDKVAFTGSSRTGAKVMAACAQSLTPVLIECGGKDALIVADDADVDAAVDACTWGAFFNAGQACVSVERAYVHEKVYDEFITKLTDQARKVNVGEEIGPITMPSQRDLIGTHIADALHRGGQALTGGADAVQGPYVTPTVLVDVPEDSIAVTDETFGPTVTVRKVTDVDEAIELANASRYGLGSTVFSRRDGVRIARRLNSGMTAVNSVFSFGLLPSLPFGGVGQSGFGRIHGDDGLREFARAKSLAIRRMPSIPVITSFRRTPAGVRLAGRFIRLIHGRHH